MERTSFFMPDRMRQQLQTLSQATGMPTSEIVRRAIDLYLQSKESQTLFAIAQREADRRAAGVPLPTIEDVERSLYFDMLDEATQNRIRQEPTELGKRRLLDEALRAHA